MSKGIKASSPRDADLNADHLPVLTSGIALLPLWLDLSVVSGAQTDMPGGKGVVCMEPGSIAHRVDSLF